MTSYMCAGRDWCKLLEIAAGVALGELAFALLATGISKLISVRAAKAQAELKRAYLEQMKQLFKDGETLSVPTVGDDA